MADRPGLRNCIACPHPSAAHEPGDVRPCRINDCGCQGFTPAEVDTGEATAEPEGRVVMLTIPDGYEMTVTLRPVGVMDATAAIEAHRLVVGSRS